MSKKKVEATADLRDELVAAFIKQVKEKFAARGNQALDEMLDEAPARFAEMIAKFMPQEIKVDNPRDFSTAQNRIEVADRIIANRNSNVIATEQLRAAIIAIEDRAVNEINELIDAAADEPAEHRQIDEIEAYRASGWKL